VAGATGAGGSGTTRDSGAAADAVKGAGFRGGAEAVPAAVARVPEAATAAGTRGGVDAGVAVGVGRGAVCTAGAGGSVVGRDARGTRGAPEGGAAVATDADVRRQSITSRNGLYSG